ncbi:cell division topological specificity factor MinE [Buchnera aphidicola]|uniref:Cell division topological specificity factor n=1 Tax=Buchnera aphidicola (Therioaphis trifolii) TaxID=1241884 RepID=A0A4D6YMQ1_9GAMM|nr:cell division topological specificity factor MinE [Buchnera aphidicola]QCI27224.1 cell division topological specificity factor MinE [Buchnera aphidicola (Therioaphis trifolii)]
MSLLDFFLFRKKNTAYIAKKRLQVIFSKKNIIHPKYFFKLKKEILSVVDKYIKITPNIINVKTNQKNPNIFILELNMIT